MNLSRAAAVAAAAAASAQPGGGGFIGFGSGNKKIRAESPLDLSGNQPLQTFPGGGGGQQRGRRSPAKVAKLDSSPSSLWPSAAAASTGFPFANPFFTVSSAAHETMAAAAAKFPPVASSPNTSSSSRSSGGSSFITATSNPLERMSEIAKTVAAKPNPTPGARHSAWQSQWINRGPQNAKDIFKCFTCSSSYPSMQDLSRHMAESGHFAPSSASSTSSGVPQTMSSKSPPSRPASVSSTASSLNNDRAGQQQQQQHHHHPQKNRDLLKEQLPVPRKLVRGQDVWLGKGEEQTKHILKCMYCGQSFRTLEELTVHMTETGHFTKVMTPEQLSANNSATNGSSPSSSGRSSSGNTGHGKNNNSNSPLSRHQQHEQVNSSVLTCKTCNQPFTSLKALGEHMVQTNHFSQEGKEQQQQQQTASKRFPNQIPLSFPSSIPPPLPSNSSTGGSSSSSGSNRKPKSLPVKTLLELERAKKMALETGLSGLDQTTLKNDYSSSRRELLASSPPRATPAQQQALIPSANCEKCGEAVPMTQFIQHTLECEPRTATSTTTRSKSNSSSSNNSCAAAAAAAAAQSPPPQLMLLPSASSEIKRPESASSSSAASVNDDARSAKSSSGSKSILGSLEDMVNHNFQGKRPAAASGEPGRPPSEHDDARGSSSVSPARSSPATPLKSLLLAGSPGVASLNKEPPLLPSSSTTSTGGGGGSHNPLAALQSFCETAEKKAGPPTNHNSPQSKRESPAGSILEFSWACNKAQVDDSSVLKCHFCDTPFVSKGAYRHHLSKVHFMKDNQIQEHPVKITSGSQAEQKANNSSSSSSSSSNREGDNNNPGAAPEAAGEDSSQNKYQKYAEMAKQLSSQTKTLSSIA